MAAEPFRLRHTTHGKGPETVIVLHEWLGSSENYSPIKPYLLKNSITWRFADLRGYGLSRTIPGRFDLDEAIADVLALADLLKLKRFHLAGHSMSGLIAQGVAAAAGDRIKSLFLIAPVPASGFKTDRDGLHRLRAILDDDEAAKAAIAARTGNRHGPGWHEAKLKMIRKAAAPEAMRSYLDMFTGSDISSRLTGLNIPALLVLGRNDLPFYRRDSIEPLFSRWFNRLEIAEILEAGHYPMLETPVRLAGLMENWVTGQAGG
jgi:3-oxoadipate enol-lactonase